MEKTPLIGKSGAFLDYFKMVIIGFLFCGKKTTRIYEKLYSSTIYHKKVISNVMTKSLAMTIIVTSSIMDFFKIANINMEENNKKKF